MPGQRTPKKGSPGNSPGPKGAAPFQAGESPKPLGTGTRSPREAAHQPCSNEIANRHRLYAGFTPRRVLA